MYPYFSFLLPLEISITCPSCKLYIFLSLKIYSLSHFTAHQVEVKEDEHNMKQSRACEKGSHHTQSDPWCNPIKLNSLKETPED